MSTKPFVAFLAALGATAALAAALTPRAPVHDEPADLWTLRRGLLGASRLEVELGATFAAELEPACRALVQRVEKRLGLPAALAVGEAAPGAARVVVGTPADAALHPLLDALDVHGVRRDGGAVELPFHGLRLAGAGDALVATFEDPVRSGRPVTLVVGWDAATLHERVGELEPLARPGLELWQAGELTLWLLLDGTDEDGRFDLERRARAERCAELELAGVSWSLPPELERGVLEARSGAVAAALARVGEWLGRAPPPGLRVELHAHLEDLARATGRDAPCVVSALGTPVHAVLAAHSAALPVDLETAVAHAAARMLVPVPRPAWLPEAVGLAAAGRFFGRPLEEWLGRLVARGLLRSPAELFAEDAAERESPLALGPLRAALVRCLAEDQPARLRALAAGELEPAELLAEPGLEGAFLRWLGQHAPAPLAAADTERRAEIVAAPPRRGVALIERGLGAPDGYGSRAADESLARAAALGADAFTLTARASVTPVAPRFAAAPRPWPGGFVSDAALAATLAAGRRLGLRPTLVLQGLATAWSARADGVPQMSAAEVGAFFADYGRLARHYALLAELTGVEILCVGEDMRFAAMTTWEVDEVYVELRRARLEGWRELLGELRAAFGGALAYDAASPHSARKLGFWDRLDFVGQEIFPRFPTFSEPPGEGRLRATFQHGLTEIGTLARELGKPLLVLQVGYPSSAEGWRDSRVPAGALDLAAQQRALALFGEALAAVPEPALRGLYVWCWPTDPAHSGPSDRGHTPRGKPAEAELASLLRAR